MDCCLAARMRDIVRLSKEPLSPCVRQVTATIRSAGSLNMPKPGPVSLGTLICVYAAHHAISSLCTCDFVCHDLHFSSGCRGITALHLEHSVAQIWAPPKYSARKSKLMLPALFTQSLEAAHSLLTPCVEAVHNHLRCPIKQGSLGSFTGPTTWEYGSAFSWRLPKCLETSFEGYK